MPKRAWRKFLVAGKSGLNLTNTAEFDAFVAEYSGTELPAAIWRECLLNLIARLCVPGQWGLGVKTFAASSGKVFPEGMKEPPCYALDRQAAFLGREFLHQSFLDRFAARHAHPLEFAPAPKR